MEDDRRSFVTWSPGLQSPSHVFDLQPTSFIDPPGHHSTGIYQPTPIRPSHWQDQQPPITQPSYNSTANHRPGLLGLPPPFQPSSMPMQQQPIGYNQYPAIPPVVIHQTVGPHLPCFSGASPVPGGEVDYTTWRRNVQESVRDMPNLPVTKVKASLRGSALKYAECCHSLADIIDRLDRVYLVDDDITRLHTDLFTAKQHRGESAQDFFIRLDCLKQKIFDINPWSPVRDEWQLKKIFWDGLQDTYAKSALHYLYASPACSTTELMRQIRTYEQDQLNRAVKPARAVSQAHTTDLAHRMTDMNISDKPREFTPSSESDEEHVTIIQKVKVCKFCQKRGHGSSNCWQRQKRDKGSNNNSRRGDGNNHRNGGHRQSAGSSTPRHDNNSRSKQHQPSSKPLNGNTPSSRGGR